MARYLIPTILNGPQPVEVITDRAKRYRANADGWPPEPRECAYCGSRQNVGVHHVDHNESNNRKENRVWACKSCNGLLGMAAKRRGLGVRTRPVNPAAAKQKGAQSFAQWASAVAAVDAERRGQGSFSFLSADDARAIIHATPASKRREFQQEVWRIRRERYGSSGRSGSEVPF